MAATKSVSKEIAYERITKFFDDLAQKIEQDKVDMLCGTLSKEKEKIYMDAMDGNPQKILANALKEFKNNTFKNIVNQFLYGVSQFSKYPEKIGISYNQQNEICFFIEVIDDNDDVCNNVLKLKKDLFKTYYPDGYYIDSIIVEKESGISMPKNFVPFPLENFSA
jgi:hypothetical protein